MESAAALLLLQLDHLSGEDLGCLVERLYELGARSVNILSTVTKKNRPGHLVLVDLDSELESRLAERVTRTFGIWGYHRIPAIHCFEQMVCETRTLSIHCKGEVLQLPVRTKRSVLGEHSGACRIEHADLRDVSERMHEKLGVRITLSELRQRINQCANQGGLLVLELRDDV